MNTRTTTLCCSCGALLTNGARLCPADAEALMADVRNATDLLADLDVTLARLDRVVPPASGGRSAEVPLPFHVGASLAAAELRAAIRSMGRGGVGCEAIARFRTARARAWEIVDIPDPRAFIGLCTCAAETPLYARSADTEVVCRACRAVWDAQPLESWEQVRRLSGPIHKLREWLLALGVQRSRAQLYRDVSPLPAIPGDSDDAPKAYLLADVLDRIAEAKAHQQRRGA